MTLLNHKEDNLFKLSLVSYTSHWNGYLDRYTDVKSKNTLVSSDGVLHRYRCNWPYKNHIEATSQFLVRVETNLKLNLTICEKEEEIDDGKLVDLIDVKDQKSV